jgi:hypothetical protein
VEADAVELLPEHRQHGAHSAADLEQPRPRLERRAVGDQPVPPVLRLLDEPLLFARPVAVDVLGQVVSPGVVGMARLLTTRPCLAFRDRARSDDPEPAAA